MQSNLVYLVEWQTEKKIVEILKSELLCVKPGRVSVLNVVQQLVSRTLFASLRGQITSVLLFDTDNDGERMLRKNIEVLKTLPNVRDAVMVFRK
jgi:nitrate reductase NapAB chaperone NapD